MLENYIERNISRKVYLCEQLFEFQEIDIEDSAKMLGVTMPTVLHDLESITACLEYCIEKYEREKHICRIIFKPGIELSELTQFLYGQSYFLKFLSYYFKGQFTSTELSDLEFISLSKVYTIKKTVLDFFKANSYLRNKQILIPEFDVRNLLLALVRYINWEGYENKSQNIAKACDELIDFIETHFFKRRYSEEEKTFIRRGIEIAIGRKDHPIYFSEEDKKIAATKPLFHIISQALAQQEEILNLQKEDIYYIFSLFNTRNYTNENMELLRKDFEVVYTSFIEQTPCFYELSKKIVKKIGKKCENDFILKKSFLQFIRTTWADGQVFLPERIYLLTAAEKELYKSLLKILSLWQEEYGLNIRWNHNLIRKFVKSIFLTMSVQEEDQPTEIFIVAPSVVKQVFYRELIISEINESTELNPMIYHSLKELPDECLYFTKRIILCDIAVYQHGFDTENTQIIPVSLNHKYLHLGKRVTSSPKMND
ncbi:hypothetical protein BH747_03545 [Enterococcus villorum]|uniref:Mga helix-turn-helix domain-containing protein n=1 Tax=Enterococcus villorum TaxID=112904 RepID=A0A1V8YMT3_9ENTE|nr:hypothetical protein [Enterococcus villorum]OQO71085.1 hypothetical protein BH747_03545 [Enterococcus villorum]OQO73904.1 hypothetical protein BH744_07870 [Enterococcus villorum]